MTDIGTGFQPTSAPTVRRADIELRRRIAVLEGAVATMAPLVEALASQVTVSSYVSFTFNANTVAPPVGNQIRLNNASQTAATHLYISHTTTDGLDVHVGLARVQPGDLIYFQDFGTATKWVRYTVVTNTMPGAYHDFTVTYESGPANVPFQKVALRVIFPGLL